LNLHNAILLFFAGAIAGALNAVAGGGSFISFPMLLFTGVPPIPANATSTLALFIGTSASGSAYRQKLGLPARLVVPLLAVGLLGGVAGALLLIRTPARTFGLVLPWLLLLATLLFAFGRYFARFISARMSHEAGSGAIASATTFELFVATYGGYFGGGMGIMNLAMFAALGMTDIHAMNKLKVVLGSTVNGVATITFIIARAIFWPQACAMTVGAAIGGYTSAHYAQKLPHSWIRALVIVVGASMTIYFFYRAYF
jgi:hypothetical protein